MRIQVSIKKIPEEDTIKAEISATAIELIFNLIPFDTVLFVRLMSLSYFIVCKKNYSCLVMVNPRLPFMYRVIPVIVPGSPRSM